MSPKKYDNSVAIAKGIAIILMVGGHASYPCYANDFLSLVRMPLFFVMSGYLFKTKYLDNSKLYLSRRISGIYLPLVKYSLFFLIIHNILYNIGIYNNIYIDIDDVSRLYVFKDFVYKGFRIVTTMHGYDRLLGGYWFLHTLFWGSILFYYSQILLKNRCIFLFCILLIVSFLLKYLGLYIPYFHIDYMPFMAASMMMFGRLYNKNNFEYHKKGLYIVISVIVVAITARVMPTAMPQCSYYQIIPYTIVSILGTMVIFSFSQFCGNFDSYFSRILTYIGKKTFAVLTWHMISFKIITLLIISLYKEPFSRLAETLVLEDYVISSWIWVVAYWIVGVLFPLFIDYCIKRVKCVITSKFSDGKSV